MKVHVEGPHTILSCILALSAPVKKSQPGFGPTILAALAEPALNKVVKEKRGNKVVRLLPALIRGGPKSSDIYSGKETFTAGEASDPVVRSRHLFEKFWSITSL